MKIRKINATPSPEISKQFLSIQFIFFSIQMQPLFQIGIFVDRIVVTQCKHLISHFIAESPI